MLDKSQIANIGKGLSFYNTFSSVTGGTNTNEGVERIKQSIEMVFSVVVGEMPILLLLGSDLPRKLFEPNDEKLHNSLQVRLEDTINYLEPRVRIRSIDVSGDDDIVYIKIDGVLRNSNITFSFDYELTRGSRADQVVSW